MKTLKVIVDDQLIRPDPNCNDFNNLVPGTEGYVRAEFIFSKEWNNTARVASFRSMLGREYPPQVLLDGRSCMIPAEALERRAFKVQIIAKRKESKLITNKLVVRQNGGKA